MTVPTQVGTQFSSQDTGFLADLEDLSRSAHANPMRIGKITKTIEPLR